MKGRGKVMDGPRLSGKTHLIGFPIATGPIGIDRHNTTYYISNNRVYWQYFKGGTTKIVLNTIVKGVTLTEP
jgi:hypothetical protein